MEKRLIKGNLTFELSIRNWLNLLWAQPSTNCIDFNSYRLTIFKSRLILKNHLILYKS